MTTIKNKNKKILRWIKGHSTIQELSSHVGRKKTTKKARYKDKGHTRKTGIVPVPLPVTRGKVL